MERISIILPNASYRKNESNASAGIQNRAFIRRSTSRLTAERLGSKLSWLSKKKTVTHSEHGRGLFGRFVAPSRRSSAGKSREQEGTFEIIRYHC